MPQKQIKLTITSKDPLRTSDLIEEIYCENGSRLDIEGQVCEILITHNGRSKYNFHIQEDGTLILTNYDNVWQTIVPTNLQLTPSNKWKD